MLHYKTKNKDENNKEKEKSEANWVFPFIFMTFSLLVSCLWSWTRCSPKFLSISSSQGSSYSPLLCQTWAMSASSCKELAAHVPCVVEPKFMCLTQSGQTNLTQSGQSLEQRKVYCRAKQGECVACAQTTPWWFSGKFLKAKYWMRVAGCVTFFRLVGGEFTGRCSRNLVLSLKLTLLYLGGSLSSCRRTQRYIVIYILWGGTKALLYRCTIVYWLLFLCFCIPSPP